MTVTMFALGSATVIGGCSFVAVQAPRKDDRGLLEAGNCTTTFLPPALDGIFIVVSVLGAQYVAHQSESGIAAASMNHDGTYIVGGTLAALFVVSALYGLSSVNNCRVARGLEPGAGPGSGRPDANRRAEEASEEAAVQARLRAKAAADAKATTEAAANPDAGAAAAAPNVKGDAATP